MDRPSPSETDRTDSTDGADRTGTAAEAAASRLIGRDHPAAVLRAEVARTARSHGGLVLVTGEAGIGKTTLVTDAADRARRQGALVLSGACWDSCDAPGHWPWTQVLRALRRGTTAGQWAEAEKTAGGGLAVLLGEAPGAADGTGDPAAGGTEGEFRLHDAVTAALVAVSQHRPLVVVLEDLHWADPASLRLLRFAAGHTWFERLLLVGTYRDDELEADGHPLRPLVLPLLTRAVTVTLTGLDRAGTGALIARTAGRRPAQELIAEVHRRTGGNPFFVEQTARLWHGAGTAAAVAPGVRDTLRHRLSLLPEAVVRLLSRAAVLGREFHRAVLAATAGESASRVDRLLERALATRLVTALGPERYAFAHDLVRETLYESLGEAERRRLHAAAVDALQSATAPAGEVLPADLARHARLAGDGIEAPRALEILLAAARDAGSRLAVEEAAGHHRRALEPAAACGDRRRQVLILLDLGNELEYLGEREAARRAFTEAVDAARETGDPGLLARVALTLHREETRRLSPDGAEGPSATGLMYEAYDRLVGGRAPGAGSGGSGASAPAAGTAPGEAATLDRLARELTVGLAVRARRGGDDEALVFGLWARHNAVWGPGSAPERVALTTELMSVARRRADLETEYLAASFRWVALLEQGDPAFLDQYRAFTALAERAGRPRADFSSCVDRSIIATLTGRFADVEPLLDRAEEYFTKRRHPHIGYMIGHLRWALWLQQGRFGELADLHRSLAGHGHPQHRILEGITALERDGPGDAAAAPALLAEIDAAGPVSPFFVPLLLRLRAQTAAVADDPELCERVRADLLPLSDQWTVSLYGCDVGGPMDLWLGVVAAARGRWGEAVKRLTAAHRSADRLGARPWSVRARLELARALLARGGPGDGPAAEALLAGVVREAEGLGMRHLAERARRTGPVGPAGPAVGGTGAGREDHGPVRLPAPEAGEARAAPVPPENVFRFDGEVWTLTYRGRTVHLPDAKGLRDLRLLLGRPGEDIPAVRLLNPAGGETAVAARRPGGDPVLDEEAKARYRERLARLDEEIDRAAALGRDDRAAAFDREREALLGELRAAAGLAGRTRRLGDEAERARKAVTARIRDTLRRLDRRHPELAAHLRAAVSTGAACRYLPPDGDGPAWRL
ncbi:ATP-binding protein [Streptomyces carminius]|uniref:ATP-binding protein n=1 Tax=Streptomyces carminius TaxID=2665496 RepID=UPI0022B92DBC|nr:AAA family ATPase [Streptomyces carminius]